VNGDQTDATDYELFGQKFCCNESKLNLKFSDGRVRIYRRRRERFADVCVKETDRFGGGGVALFRR
jgi:hypothetical protein